MDNNTAFKILVSKQGNHYIAKAIDYTFVAQGPTHDAAVECLVGCILAQKAYDEKKGIDPWSNHLTKKGTYLHLFETRHKYKAEIEFDTDSTRLPLQLANQ
ncbi:hypothetical protein [Leptospira sarikeiensis]|uniref:Uncharacterized protein n=1 Tax=Leptospira sarikeiensis TaxID=2484943 RepID=A0A4R9K4I4_9LEPT|nr:hypothetical protein [Leptospira sarikeiensis]TGL61039.1 hypothetical protein EHQ64_14705 [Leptospira sarikeiensis]